mmetsp:Transcript_24352/g.51659  ORF Transcript_24352/g.51659 Transcript_24352/m.51659 type:complete len:437 (+) Transcript_24352:33-1343(+)
MFMLTKTMAKRTIGLALPLLLCGALPAAHSFSLKMSATLPKSMLSHPNDPTRMLEYKNLDAGMNGGLQTTKAGGTLLDDLADEHNFTPLERMFLTLSGNVQTAFSSYYLREVEISAEMKPADITPPTSPGKLPLAVFDRKVKVNVGGLKCFKVTAKVKVYDPVLLDAYTSRSVGLDQLLKMFGIRPKFTLQDAGRNPDGGLWRFYTLECHKGLVDFELLEEFEKDAFNLNLPNNRRIKSQIMHPNYPGRKLTKANDNVYNIRDELTTMSSGGNLIYYLADAYDLTPLERVAVTANGQLQMMFSSYYLGEVNVAVTRNVQMDIPAEELATPKPPIAMFDREVLQTISGHLWCKATTIVRVYDEEVLEAYNNTPIWNLLQKLNLNPKHKLHDAGRSDDGGMWRFYTMACPGVIEFDILEEIPADGWNLPCMPEKDVGQ